ncbi:MAG: type IV pilus twitching motility protein PilT, partial [Myxococcota bacterium]
RILVRVKGNLHGLNVPRLTPEDTDHLFNALLPEHLSGLTPETLKEVDFSFAVEGAGRFRVNAFRQRGSVALVIRVIPIQIPNFSQLNLPDALVGIAEEQRGLVLITGSTGCGKSTTLAAIIDHINKTRTAHVITIEDPIEFLFLNERSSVVQRELGTDTSSMAGALKAALRQDPDVIMIGEMRDTDTIDTAIKAAETGHLVLSTAHTTDAARTIHRLLSVFPTAEQQMVRYRISESLRAIVSQRLLQRADGSGLIPAVEVMIASRAIQEIIRNPERTFEMTEFISKGKNYGMQTFDRSLMQLLRQGKITKEAALSAATSPGDLDLQLRLDGGEDVELELEYTSYAERPDESDLPPARSASPPETPDEPAAEEDGAAEEN